MKKICIFFFLMITFYSKAQTLFGIKAGVTFSKFSVSDSVFDSSPAALTAFTAGIPLVFKISDKFSIQPEINYVSKGADFGQNLGFISYDIKYKINYIEIPVLAKLSLHDKKFDFNLLAGPSIAYGLKAKIHSELKSLFGNNTTDSTLDFKKNYLNRTDVCLNFGAGFSYPLGVQTIFLDIRYQVGLSNLDTYDAPANSGNPAIHTSGFMISGGILFPLYNNYQVPVKK
jgi:hypothetical protein